jgi:Tol biopolymer transport system component
MTAFQSERPGNKDVYVTNSNGSGAAVDITNDPSYDQPRSGDRSTRLSQLLH